MTSFLSDSVFFCSARMGKQPSFVQSILCGVTLRQWVHLCKLGQMWTSRTKWVNLISC